MAKTPDSEVSELNLLPDKNSFLNCKLKIQWPTFRYRKEESCLKVLNRLKQERRSEINRQKFSGLVSNEKSKVYCSHEDPLKKAEIHKRKMLQKIKRVYRINLDGLNEHVINEIILKVNLLEKQKREREKRKAEKNFIMMRRLIDEQKYKMRVKKQTFPPRLKKIKFLPCIDEPHSEKEEKIFEGESGEVENLSNDLEEIKDKFEEEEIQKKSISTCGRFSIEPRASSIIRSDRSYMGEGEEIDFKVLPKTAKCVLREKSLSSTPEKIIFENYVKDKVYLKDLKITNMGIESIHCRYLGIAVHTEGEDKFPVGVAVRDSVLLRPGLWCSTKVRLCASDDTKQLECSIVYETRRKTNPFQHAWLLIPVVCYPCKANIKITPLRIMFPSITWYEAKKTEKKKLFKKFIKLENIGAKSCFCKIVKERKSVSEYGEIDDYQSEENVEEMAEVKESSRESLNGEDDSEGYRALSYLEGVNNACLLLDEIFDNIFATFRFVPKYHIELPPQSTQYVEVKFTPEYKGFHHDIYYIQFDKYDVAEQSIELIGNIKNLPIRSQPTVIDLKICTLNSGVYVSSFKVFNDNPTSYTVAVKIPLALRNHCHVSPSTITILGRDFREFVITFYPRVNIKEEAKKFYKADLGLLEFPLHIHPASITACKYDFIKIYVFAVITDYILELNPPSIDFGTVTTLETVSTKIELTNHSLAAQEFGFLNLPKGVAVEPNMGFGMILPRETITLDLLYSPQPGTYECDYKGENRAFEIEITSIAEYGGFGEIFESERESVPVESSWIGESFLKTPTENIEGFGEEEEVEEEGEKEKKEKNEESEGGIEVEQNGEFKSESELEEEKCEDDSSIEETELFTMLQKEETKIRNFLKEDRQVPSNHSFFDKISLLGVQEELKPEVEEQVVEYHENDPLKENIFFREAFRPDMNSIKCKAHVIKPVCQLSETIIQLPATPYTSFSLYRFHIIGSNLASNTCVCGRSKKSCEGKPNFEAAFEFTYSSPHIKLEPRSGYLRAGERLPITIVFRPEFETEQLVHEARIQKARDILSEKKLSLPKPETSKGKTKPSQPSTKKGEARESDRVEKVINVTTLDLENTDLFAGQKALLEFISHSCSEVPVHCVVKVKDCGGRESTECHDLIFICPITKPKFKYIGLSQEINFGRVLVHTCAHYVLEIQNISLERIQPEMSLLNPNGPFSCLGGLVKRDVDPEHIWRQVITFNPVKTKGIEKEFFEIKYGLTNIFFTVTGESYTPEIKLEEFDRKKASFAKDKFTKSKSVLGIDDNRSKSSKVGIVEKSKKGRADKSKEELQSIKSEVLKSLQFGDAK